MPLTTLSPWWQVVRAELAEVFSRREVRSMNKVFFDGAHVFHHYLESAIPGEEWEHMSVEEALGIAKDAAAVLEGNMSPSEFGKKYNLPRK
jgi:hypothetical protein